MMSEDLIQAVHGALERRLAENLTKGETLLVKLKGTFKEALVCTNSRVLILKSGFMTGQMFGSDLFQLPYPAIASAQVKFGVLNGYFEVSAGGMQNTPKSYWSQSRDSDPKQAPNCVSLSGRTMAEQFRRACTLIMEQVSASRTPMVATTPTAPNRDMAGEIERLWKLHADGALTREEYESGKAKLLA